MCYDTDSNHSMSFFANRITRPITVAFLLVFILVPFPAQAQDCGIESLRQSGKAFVAVARQASPANKAGLKQGDVLVEFAGKPVEKVGAFRNRVALKTPGSKEKLTVLRSGKRKTLSITIGKLADNELAAAGTPHSLEKLGLTVQTLTTDLARQFEIQGKKGVVIMQVRPGSAAALAGINPGAVILEVNRKPISNTEEFKRVLAQTPKKGTVLLLIKDGQYSRYVALKTG